MRIYLRMSVMVTLDEVRALVVPCYTLKIWRKKITVVRKNDTRYRYRKKLFL
jgi:tRNA nucleotidyltransferase (CCA-adding enzyme)